MLRPVLHPCFHIIYIISLLSKLNKTEKKNPTFLHKFTITNLAGER